MGKLLNDKENKRKIKVLAIVIIIVILILVTFFIKNNYKKQNSGNNMSNKNLEEIEEYILNISSYEARIEVNIESNKNKNKYLMDQLYIKDQISKQKIIEPSNIKDLEIIYEGNELKIKETRLNLTTIYKQYNYLVYASDLT